jgi:hypothetical protein
MLNGAECINGAVWSARVAIGGNTDWPLDSVTSSDFLVWFHLVVG